MSIRSRFYHDLEPRARPEGLSLANKLIAALIVIAAVVAVLETEPTLREPHADTFLTLQLVFGVVFLIEYLLRIWVAAEDPRFAGKRFGRLRWMVTPSGIIDFLALLPLFLTLASANLYWLRVARILRILRIIRLGRMSRAFDNVIIALYHRRFELGVAVMIALLLMLFSATLLYFAEAEAQPEAFGSVPRALWWAVVTLTTIGYGDVYPVTLLGRVCAALIAISGIGVIAMPTGIFAAAFSDAMQKQEEDEE